MDRGKKFGGLKQWKCDGDPSHILGLLKRVESSVVIDGTIIRYQTTQLMLFKQAIDINAEVPDEVDVVGYVDGLMLTNMSWKCTCCGVIKKWHPGEEALLWLKVMNGKR